MPETEADRILRERARQRQRDEAAGTQAAIDAIQRVAQVCEAEIPIVLELFARAGYPWMEEITVVIKAPKASWRTWFTGDPDPAVTETKAAWKLADYKVRLYGDAVTEHIYLLSDGRIVLDSSIYGRQPTTPSALADALLSSPSTIARAPLEPESRWADAPDRPLTLMDYLVEGLQRHRKALERMLESQQPRP